MPAARRCCRMRSRVAGAGAGRGSAKAAKADDRRGEAKDEPISPVTVALSEYVAETLDRDMPPEVVAKTKLHVLDTIAAMVSGSRLKAGEFAARYVDSLGGKPQATVIGTPIVTSSVNAALANGMAAHGDETDDSHLAGRFHPGCGIVPAALATAELAGRSGNDVLRAVALGYDIGARPIFALGFRTALYRAPLDPQRRDHLRGDGGGGRDAAARSAPGAPCLLVRGAAGLGRALLGARPRACGEGVRLRRHGGAQRRHRRHHDRGGLHRRRRLHQRQQEHVHRARRQNAAPEKLAAELGKRYEVMNTSIKKWTVGSPLQSVLDGVTVLLEDPAVRAGKVRRIVVDMPADRLHIVDNRTISDICLQHLVAMMIVDGGAAFDSVHDIARMNDPKVLAIRKLVEAVPNQELVTAVPARQSIVKIETTDGRTLSHRTYEVRGTPGNPMSAEEVAAKALDLMAPILGKARAEELNAAIGFDTFGPVLNLRRLVQA